MHRAAINSRFLMGLFSSSKRAEAQGAPHAGGLYHQEIVSAAMKRLGDGQACSYFARGLVTMVEQAHVFRRMDAVEQISSALIDPSFPREFRVIGAYFQALCVRQDSEDGLFRSTALLESVVGQAPSQYRAKALLSLGTNAKNAHDYESGLGLYFDAARVAVGESRDSETAVQAQKMLAVVKSIAGDHRGALASLEALYPLARRVGSWHPHVYYDYLNSLALELGETGRVHEAANVSKLAVASPFSHAYPEWSETRDEIAQRGRGASRSFVPVLLASSQPPNGLSASAAVENVVARPAREDSGIAKQRQRHCQRTTARLLLFPERRTRPAESDGATLPQRNIQERASMTPSEKRAVVASLLFSEDSPAVIDRMLEAAGLVAGYPADEGLPRRLDLESPDELEELIRRWLNGAIEPDELAAVLSALRDCEDELRRTNILDQMISIAFVETVQHYESERDWRKRVEARLTSLRAEH
jgi:hypothetical protein